jgi:histidinol dehydrogenase
MTAIPARVAGVREVVVATPCRERGEVPPVTLVACDIAKVDRVFRIGGPQAIAAMAYGTESVPRVDKIYGPGNAFVQLAKKAVFGTVGVDAIQGPTETMVVADESADPRLCAVDMLAQAEHAEDAKPTLLTTSDRLARQVAQEVERELRRYDQSSPAHRSTATYGVIAVLKSLDEAAEVANAYAPEHLCLLVKDPWGAVGKFTNAGGIFLGESSPEVLGDYVAGPSHVMPTAGTARFTSSLNVMDFVKITSIVGLSEATMRRVGPAAGRLGHGEGLPAHARAIEVRLEKTKEESD